MHGDKAGAKTFDARNVFVAGALVDVALAAEVGLQRLHAHAIALHAAVAAALADQRVDHHPRGRVDHGAALAAAALFGGTGLVINDDGGAFDLAQRALHRVEHVAVLHRYAVGQALHALVFFGFVGDHHDALRALSPHALRDLHHAVSFCALTNRLPARHGHRVVVQNFVGDVHASRDRLAHRQDAAVEIGAVAQIGKDMAVVGKRLLPDPGRALAAHLREARGRAVHPQGHEMAADAGHRARSLGHAGRGVVRAARTKPGLALGQRRAQSQRLHGPLFGVQNRQLRVHAGLHIGVHAQRCEALRNRAGNHGRRQIGIGAQQAVGGGVGRRPFTANAIGAGRVVGHRELAHHTRAHIGAPVVQLFFELVFNDLALFFHHQNLLQAGGKFACELRLQRPDHRHLVQADAHAAAGGIVQAQIEQGLARVVVALAAGHQAEAVVRAFDDVVVQPVGAHIGQRRVPLGVKQPRLLVQSRVRPADVDATRRHHKVGGRDDLHPLRVHVDRRAGLHNFLDGLHASPDAGVAAHRKGMQPQVQNVLHPGREKQRRAAGLENVVALVRSGGAFGHMVIPRHRQHAAPRCGARHIGVLENV